ncbi:MAG: SRPBCC domain-containing protein [Betaproteobacteria bacterium]
MKLQLDGSFDVEATPTEVFAFLTDPMRFAPLLPMFRELREVESQRFKVILEVGVPQIRGTVEATVTVVELLAGTRARYKSSTRHTLGMADSDIGFELAPRGTGTRVVWRSETLVRGTLASIANGILMPLAKRNVQAMIDALRTALGGGPTQVQARNSPDDAVPIAHSGWWARLLAVLGMGKRDSQ